VGHPSGCPDDALFHAHILYCGAEQFGECGALNEWLGVAPHAQAAGTLREVVPPLVAVDLLFGPLFYRRFIRHEPVTGSYVKQVFENVMAGMGAKAGTRTKRRPR
jgi:hypothetical protein